MDRHKLIKNNFSNNQISRETDSSQVFRNKMNTK